MQLPVLLPGAISDLFAHASRSGYLTKADCYGLMAAVLEEDLGQEERSAIDRLLSAVRRGRIRVVSEMSVVLW